MSLRLYNTLTRQREDFAPADGRTVALHIDGSPHPFALQEHDDVVERGDLVAIHGCLQSTNGVNLADNHASTLATHCLG